MPPIPNFFIVGQPKSGTSALHAMLAQHPDIFMSRDKEPKYFCRDFLQEAKEHSRMSSYKSRYKYLTEDKYLDLFATAQSYKIRGESTTNYLYSKVAAKEIYTFNAAARILIILRNPVHFLPSTHSQMVALGLETETDFQNALKLEVSRKQGENVPPNVHNPSRLYYSERAKYTEQVQRYLNLFGQEQLKILVYEDFKRDNMRTLRSVLEFLEVNPDFEPQVLQVNMNKSPRNHIINELFFNPAFRRALQFFVPEKISSNPQLKNFFKRCLWKQTEREPLPQDLVEYLHRLFLPEVERLSALLQIDLVQKWGFDAYK